MLLMQLFIWFLRFFTSRLVKLKEIGFITKQIKDIVISFGLTAYIYYLPVNNVILLLGLVT